MQTFASIFRGAIHQKHILGLGFAFALVLLVTWAHRVVIMLIYYDNIRYGSHYRSKDGYNAGAEYLREFWPAIALGMKSDVLFAAAVALVLTFFGRIGLYAGLTGLAFFYAANSEHIRYNESNIDLSQAGLALDPTFIAGQSTQSLFVIAILFLGIFLLTLWFARRPIVRAGIAIFVGVVGIVVALIPAEIRYDQPIWMQSHPMTPQLGFVEVPTDDRDFVSTPLTSPPAPIQPVAGQFNVLMVYLEGLSETSLSISDMSHVQQLADNNIHFRQYFGHQVLTANGLYSTHTARLPYFTSVPMRWYELDASSPEVETALPRLLKDIGYQTAFIQSAPLGFMRKDEKLPFLGYDLVVGGDQFTSAHQRNGWGVDDLTLMEETLAQIDRFDPDRPWFTSILTTGTHSPYNVPAEFLPNAGRDRYRASRYADDAVAALMQGLTERDLLKNTVVVITSDESREYSSDLPLETEVRRSWLPLVIVHPNGTRTSIDGPVAMMDVRDLVLAATGDLTRAKIDAITNQRDIFMFGNARLRQFFYYEAPSKQLFACDTSQFICTLYADVSDLRDLSDARELQLNRFPELEKMIRDREGENIYCETDLAVCEGSGAID
ncbi:LTA synthase family protein [Yoonia sediminilitoris]|uniref:Sulfatase-like protein n=1 Tax=Yoonia sediminilitoris TaxID=1286148 RepID=A0A2T6K9L8_9RHOB|nr:LTA synthase family protein [Yoonia sediminilitoris]PUB11496.1 sulfatase-like protein [Yoonia sediminilitoris]RCW91696.1 sulfatase-like protein [Yoonia sediminilitoris]